SGQHITHLFDLMAGSSTGGLLILALNVPDEQGHPAYTAEEIAQIYEIDGPKIFSASVWHRVQSVGSIASTKYSTEGIEEVVDHWFGDLHLSDSLGDVLITSYEIQQRQPWFFRSMEARYSSRCEFSMRDVARATTAAPTFFEPARIPHPELPDDQFFALIDGSMQASNPTMAAYVDAKSRQPNAEEFFVLSLGTGDHTHPIDYDEARSWGLAGWAQHMLEIMFDGMNNSVHYQMKNLIASRGDGTPMYYRLQPRLDSASEEMDDVSEKNIIALKDLVGELIDQNDSLLDQIVDQLLA
ncbi:MAG: patatin-like phospholipase family protein, partial [Anaerolineae bacterium]|nr:patatin-like phospholipase family protein [Anaerolineae bacterium]